MLEERKSEISVGCWKRKIGRKYIGENSDKCHLELVESSHQLIFEENLFF
jgi:hypothetical protein